MKQEISSDYIDNKKNTIIHGDCLEVMKKIPDNYFDLCLTDPPYGIGASNSSLGLRREHKHKRVWTKKKWDNEVPKDEVFNEISRISKNQIIWGGNYFNLPPCKNYIVWDKQITGDVPFAHCEMAWTSYSKAPTIVRIPVQSLPEKRVHPTQKPLSLFTYCIQNYENIKTVFDPFLGSGTTAITCQALGIDWWGCELEEDYIKVAEKRLTKVQGCLF